MLGEENKNSLAGKLLENFYDGKIVSDYLCSHEFPDSDLFPAGTTL